MRSAPHERGGAPWIALLSLVVLAAGLGFAVLQWNAHDPRRHPKSPADLHAEPAADVVEEALGGADDSLLKTLWRDEVPGVDLQALPAGQREVFLRFANARACTCGCGYTLAACRTYDSSCAVSRKMVQALYDSVRTGEIHSARGVRARPVHGG